MIDTIDKPDVVSDSLNDLVRCDSCENFEIIGKLNRPPIGKCNADFHVPIAFQCDARMIWTTTKVHGCKFYTPNDLNEPRGDQA